MAAQGSPAVPESERTAWEWWWWGYGWVRTGGFHCPMTLLTNESSSSSSLIPTKWSTTSPPRMAMTVGTAETWGQTRRRKTELVTLWLNKTSYKYDDRILHPSTAEINQTGGQECHKDILKIGLTPYSMAKSVWSSMSTFAMATRPFCFATAFSNLGPRILQGPHHLKNTKQKETNSINLF